MFSQKSKKKLLGQNKKGTTDCKEPEPGITVKLFHKRFKMKLAAFDFKQINKLTPRKKSMSRDSSPLVSYRIKRGRFEQTLERFDKQTNSPPLSKEKFE